MTLRDGTSCSGIWSNGSFNQAMAVTRKNRDEAQCEQQTQSERDAGISTLSDMGRQRQLNLEYKGDWSKGRRDGRGIQIYADGSRYEGWWHDNERSGRGVQIYADGRRYDGEWKADKLDGQGTMTLRDGTSCSGIWSNGSFKQGNR